MFASLERRDEQKKANHHLISDSLAINAKISRDEILHLRNYQTNTWRTIKNMYTTRTRILIDLLICVAKIQSWMFSNQWNATEIIVHSSSSCSIDRKLATPIIEFIKIWRKTITLWLRHSHICVFPLPLNRISLNLLQFPYVERSH